MSRLFKIQISTIRSLIWMHGGPSQLDTFDLKPAAPSQYPGAFQPIATNLPGLAICELLPEHAKVIGVEDFSAIVYHAMGLKVDDSIMDLSGRPTHLVPGGEAPSELLEGERQILAKAC